MKIEELIIQWNKSQLLLKQMKKDEMELRIQIAEELLEGKEVGPHDFEFDGFSVKVTKKTNIKLLEDELDSLKDELTPEERDCVTYKPTLSKSKYALLADTFILDECIIVTPATPTIAYKEDTE